MVRRVPLSRTACARDGQPVWRWRGFKPHDIRKNGGGALDPACARPVELGRTHSAPILQRAKPMLSL
eukprot:3325950-Prymnesium_polylepis.1